MLNEEKRVVSPENETEETVVAKNQKDNVIIIDQVITSVGAASMNLVKTADAKDAAKRVKSILTTVFALNALDEYATGLKIGGELYRYNDYEVTAGMAKLLVPSKVVVIDNLSAKDFLNHQMYESHQFKPLTPAEMKLNIKKVCTYLRTNPEFHVVSRPSVGLLSDAAKYAVVSRKVVDAKQPCVYFLNLKCDEEARVNISEWCQNIVLSLFS